MHVCCVITSFTSGGAEMLVGNLAEAFCAQGHAATVLALSDAATIGNDAAIEAAMIARLKQSGVTARSLGLRDRRNPLAGARALRRALADHPPDILHAHTAAALPAIALLRPRCPVVLTHHNSRLSFPPWAYRLFDRVVASYVAISDQCAAQTARHARKPIRRIANAASPRFQATAPRTAPARDPVILAVGIVSEQKDYPTLIRAARPLAEALAGSGRRPSIWIAGGGQAIDALRALVSTERAEDFVELLGPRSDVEALMAGADIFANSSLWEGFSIAMIEASMSALPIVATDVAGNCEMVIAGRNGMLVPAGDPAALADAIAAIVTEDAHYAALSAGALESAARFSIEVCAATHLALYRDVITGARPWRAAGDAVLG
jgi:glycosyltransferase involved in cell wall biosynthesis